MSKAMLIWVSILAGLQMLSGAAVLTDLVGIKFGGIFVVVVGALQVATATYQKGLVTPTPGTEPETPALRSGR